MGPQLPDPNAIGNGFIDGLILYELRTIRGLLEDLVKLEQERREAEKGLEALAESLKRGPGPQEGATPLSEAETASWDLIPWEAGDGEVYAESDWWYRDDKKVLRARKDDRPLTQDEITLIMNPPGRVQRKR